MWGEVIPSIGAIWFLLALFWASLLLNFIIRVRQLVGQAIIVISLTIFGVIVGNYIWLPLDICNGMVVLLFVWLGYLAKKYNFLSYIFAHKILLIPLIIVWIFQICIGGVSLAVNQYDYGVLFFLGTISASICMAYIVFSTASLRLLSSIYRMFGWLGRHSLIILCAHIIELNCIPLGSILSLYMTNHVNTIVFVFRLAWIRLCLLFVEKNSFLQKIFSRV